jgi:hypothetical protein
MMKRRADAYSLHLKGKNQFEIADELDIDQTTVSRDLKAYHEYSQQFVFDLVKGKAGLVFQGTILTFSRLIRTGHSVARSSVN